MKVRAFDMWGERSFSTGLEVLCLRQAQQEAEQAEQQASLASQQLASEASAEHAQLTPFYQREMTAEHAFDPTQLNEMLTAAGAGTGAAAGAATTEAKRQAATTGNASGQSAALDAIARERMKTGAGVSESIAGKDVEGALQMRQAGAQGMSGLYGEDLKGQLAAMGQESADINTEINASKTGWLQNVEGVIDTGANVANTAKYASS
jgi:hypothetical protein